MNVFKFLICALLLTALPAGACTSLVASGRATASGRPLLWKNRDTSALENFVCRTDSPGQIPYIALYNAGDSLLREAWAGMNEAGLAIMNTASYNLAPDTAALKDREGVVMSRALATCRTVADFDSLLRVLPKPLGIQANFGVIDAEGGAAYFEADDWHWTRYDADAEPEGVLIRTNYSVSGTTDGGYGYIRHDNARHLVEPMLRRGALSGRTLVDKVSRSFYHSVLGRNPMSDGDRWVVDQDFIPRGSTSAAVAVENPGPDAVMWVILGYPPVGTLRRATFGAIPAEIRPDDTWHAPDATEAMRRRALAFPVTRGSGPKYVDLEAIRQLNAAK